MFKMTIMHCGDDPHGQLKFRVFTAILEEYRIDYELQRNMMDCMKLSKGRCNPSFGVICVAPNGKVVTNSFELVTLLESYALRPLA